MEVSLIFLIQFFAFVDSGDQFLSRSEARIKMSEISIVDPLLLWNIPKTSTTVLDVSFASVDHLVGDFHEERCHSFGRIVVLRNAVNHSDGVHQTWNIFGNRVLKKKRQRLSL